MYTIKDAGTCMVCRCQRIQTFYHSVVDRTATSSLQSKVYSVAACQPEINFVITAILVFNKS